MAGQRTYDTLLGVTIGNYRLEQLLGQSKYGPLFLARSLADDTHALLRFLAPPSELTGEARIVYLGLFQQKASRVAALRHPHILPVIDYGNYQGMPYLVQPTVAITTLRSQLTKYGPPNLLTSSRILDQVADALEYAHQHAVLHRNLSTDCILLARKPGAERERGETTDTVLVTDFGLMYLLEMSSSNSSAVSESSGDVYRLYASSESIAPEEVLGSSGKAVDTYTDVYAMGAVLYRLLTGHAVFQGANRDDILQKHVQTAMPPLDAPRLSNPEIQARLNSLLAHAMAKDPDLRLRHPGELADSFHALVAPDDTARKAFAITVPPSAQRLAVVGPAAPLSPPPVQRYMRRRVSRRTMIIGGSSVAVAAIALLLGSHYLTGSTSPTASTTSVTGTSVPAPTNAASSPGTGGSTPAPSHSGTVIARISDVPLNSAKTFPNGNNPNPGILVHLPDNRFVAFDSTCTHQGCPVGYNAQTKLLLCPCHQAEFDPAHGATVVQGPAQTPLTAIHITTNADGTITTSS